jgi:hypothetical protein
MRKSAFFYACACICTRGGSSREIEQCDEFVSDGLCRCTGDLLADDAAGKTIEGVYLFCKAGGGEERTGVCFDDGFKARVCGDEVSEALV